MRIHRSLARLVRAALSVQLLAGLSAVAGAQAPDSTRPAPLLAMADTTTPRGTAGIAGQVTDATGKPLAGAVVAPVGLVAGDLSTPRGQFAVRGLPHGLRTFTVRRVGYLPAVFDIELPPNATVHLQVTLQPSMVMLGAIVVDGESRPLNLFKNGFYDRAARQPLGYFYPPEEMDRRNLTTLASLLTEIPGLHIERRNNNDAIALGRNVGAGPCELNLWVDGALARVGSAPLDQLAPAHLVRAVEVYPSAASVPLSYVRANNLCGAIVVWTRGVAR
jgi:hypothetical protein